MSSLLKSCSNTRSIIPGSLKYIRSDVPVSLTGEEVDWLRGNNVRCIIDLRSREEQERKPCPLSGEPDFHYSSIPLTGGSAVPASPDLVGVSYINMVDEQMEKVFRLLSSAKGGVLYFCNAGKDRTGVVSALLLSCLGCDRETIFEDYLRSGDNLREQLLAFAKQDESIDLQVITPQRRYMEEFLSSPIVMNFCIEHKNLK